MADTTYARSIDVAPWFQPPEFSNPVATLDWRTMATAVVDRPTGDNNWHVTCVFTASVDTGTEGQVRLRTSEGNESSIAYIVGHVGPVLLGWTRITDWSVDSRIRVFLEGRRVAGVGGGVRIHRAALSLESAPSSGPDVIYPDGYDPGVAGSYPPAYTTPTPYV